jgi:phage gpG-like protein
VGFSFFVETQGTKEVATSFRRMGYAAAHAQPAFRTISLLIMEIMDRVFDSEGRRGGGSWKLDSVDWLERKMRMGLDPRINHATLALRDSVTVPGAEGQIMEITSNALYFGSDLPYAGVTQENRPFMKFMPQDRAEMRNIIRDYLIAAWELNR